MECLVNLYRLFPGPLEDNPNIRGYYWAAVLACWLLTFLPLRNPRNDGRARNYSIVDRIWSAYPLSLTVLWVFDASWESLDSKSLAAVGLVAIWALRLTYSSYRRGDYQWGEEDYRWQHVLEGFKRLPGGNQISWELFNFLGLAWFQVTLLYLISLPVRRLIFSQPPMVSDQGANDWSYGEMALVALMFVALEWEAVADLQQYRFQTMKKRSRQGEDTLDIQSRKGEIEAGFVYTGLWRYSRHPNVFSEQVFWILMAVFSGVATKGQQTEAGWLVVAAGPVMLASLLWASVQLAESISLSKYPLYRAYQLRTSRLVPWRPRTNQQVISHKKAK